MTINCVQAYDEIVGTDIAEQLSGEGLLLNFLYNTGFMLNDVLDILYFDPEATESDYWYYFFYKSGDFLIRIIYHDES